MTKLGDIAVILVSPKGALNVGSVARLLGNFGIKDFRLVAPRCDLKSVECKQMAMHSFGLVESAKIFPDLQSAVADLTQVVALSGRSVEDRRPSADIYEVQDKICAKWNSEDRVGLVFGREEIGLKLEELCLCHWQVEIPTSGEHSSINLASAVGISLSWFHQVLKAETSVEEFQIDRPKMGQDIIFFERMQKLMDEVKFSNKENPTQLRDDLWSIFHRADLDDRELRILFGILTALENSIRQKVFHPPALHQKN